MKSLVLEFEFEKEEGSGLGPTLEYYTLIAQEIGKPDNKLFRKADDGSLFPWAVPTSESLKNTKNKKKDYQFEAIKKIEKTQYIYKLLGTIVARAILDDRIVDVRFNQVFWDLVLNKVLFFFKIQINYFLKIIFKAVVF